MKKLFVIALSMMIVASGAYAQNRRTSSDNSNKAATQVNKAQPQQQQKPQAQPQQKQTQQKQQQQKPPQQKQQPQQPPQQKQQPQQPPQQKQAQQKQQPQQPPRQPAPPQQRIGQAKQNMDNARRDYRNTRNQVRVDEIQRHAYMNPNSRIIRKPEPKRPQIAPVPKYTREQLSIRTNATQIVVDTRFRTKQEAAQYIRRMLEDRYYMVDHYSSSTVTTVLTEVPTGFVTKSLFSMRFSITKYFGVIRVTMTSQWREPSLMSALISLIFQPDDNYETYYAWNVLEDIAYSLPHSTIRYQ